MSRGVRYALSGFALADDAQLLGELTDAVASRVLLTRTRLGMVTWIPPGKAGDRTLDPVRFDRARSLLEAAGVQELRQEFEGTQA